MKKIFFSLLILTAMLATVMVFARISASKNDFKQAEDFPRDALIYIQIQDLPALIRLWNESELKQKYMETRNFGEFENNHLAMKLAERAGEIEEGIKIFPDLSFAAGLSENRAALAVYDIGKMEFVFIAPMTEEKILASKLFEIQENFEKIQLDKDTTVYSKEIDVDRARQRQKVLFARFRGRLILATSEKYFLQTIDNIKGKTPKNRLSAEPSFAQLAAKTKPNLATAWLNQQKLNDDWYFKHYWLMSEMEALKNLRAAMFDFDIRDKKAFERRVFLTAENRTASKINAAAANRLGSFIPANISFYKIESAAQDDFEKAVSNALFDVNAGSETDKSRRDRNYYYFRDWDKSWSYSYLDGDFSEQVDDAETDDLPGKTAVKARYDLTKIIGAANPSVSLKMFSPQNLPAPLFFENRKALIFSLQNHGNLNRKELEAALMETAQNLLTVKNQKSNFAWTDFPLPGLAARQMAMPSLGWNIFYCVRQNELIFSASEDLLKDILAAQKSAPEFAENFENLTVINFENGREAFDETFTTLEEDRMKLQNSNESRFFTENIGSLLDVVSDVERVEIKQNSAGNFLFEEIGFVLKESAE